MFVDEHGKELDLPSMGMTTDNILFPEFMERKYGSPTTIENELERYRSMDPCHKFFNAVVILALLFLVLCYLMLL